MFKRIIFAIPLLLGLGFAQTTTCPGPTPGAPHVCLTWTDSTTTGATYNVYRATTAGGENYASPLNATPLIAGSTAYYDTTVATGTQYFYTVVAVGTGGGLSTPSNEVSAQVPVPPNPPTNAKASND